MAEGYFNHFDEIAGKLETALSQIVRTAAFNIQAGAQQNAPVDTGFLKNSIYTVTSSDSNYSAGGEDSKHQLLPEIEHPTSSTEAAVAVGASYGVYQEFGWVHGAAQPYLTPAVEAERSAFLAALQQLGDKLM